MIQPTLQRVKAFLACSTEQMNSDMAQTSSINGCGSEPVPKLISAEKVAPEDMDLDSKCRGTFQSARIPPL